ncbi:MAG TPA: NADH-quinone oxidoreductase subunit H [Candidatus Polarisedimenticolia bacterium]
MRPELLLLHALSLAAAPLLPGLIVRTKALIAGRTGPPLLQGYSDLWKLMGKGAVYSDVTSWLFRAGPVAGLASVVTAWCLLPSWGVSAPLSFAGDLVLFVCLLGLSRFLTVLAALDTGSSFEGMGASREITFSALTEPALFLALATLARATGATSLSGMLGGRMTHAWGAAGSSLALTAVCLFVVLLAENARIPVDDPATHLELTMIHEVMVLDHGGPDLAFIQYGAALKLWVFQALLVGLTLPVRTGGLLADAAAFLMGMIILSMVIGVVESIMARLQLSRVPQLLIGAGALAAFGLILTVR